VVDDKLYLIIYLAVKTYYYDKHLDEALKVIQSARIGADQGTAGWYGVTQEVAAAPPLEDVSGIYISEITTSSNWQFQKRYKDLKLTVTQTGSEIIAVDSRYDTRITGTFDGRVITFIVDANQVSGFYEAQGEWRLREDGSGFDGHWSARGGADAGSGTWNLRRQP